MAIAEPSMVPCQLPSSDLRIVSSLTLMRGSRSLASTAGSRSPAMMLSTISHADNGNISARVSRRRGNAFHLSERHRCRAVSAPEHYCLGGQIAPGRDIIFPGFVFPGPLWREEW
jgi:hypothetical protein